MEGYDDKAIATDASRRYARYTNLAPGDYTFTVVASNNEDIWNTEGHAIRLHISPPWWRTTAAYILWGALTLGFIYWLYRFQFTRQMEKAERIRLKEMDILKTKIYQNITHEFRTPLTIILGVVRQLQNQVSEHAKDSLELIKRNGRQLLKLVNEMLDLSKMESGQLKLEQEQGDIINYLKYLLESFHSLAENKKIRLHFMSDLREFYMDYDPVRLMYVISNLLSNAIKFTPEGRDVYVSVQHQTRSQISESIITDASEVLIFTVKDTGIGIPEEKLPFVFDRFYQVDDSVTRIGEGTGIGLTLTKELIKLMGGDIKVESELGGGE